MEIVPEWNQGNCKNRPHAIRTTCYLGTSELTRSEVRDTFGNCSFRFWRKNVSWQIYEKTRERKASEPTLTISKKFGRFAFNSSAAETMKKNAMETVLLMWNPESLQIGIRNVMKKDARAYLLRFTKKQYGAGFGARSFLNHIGYDYSTTRSFPCEWNEHEGIFTVQLTEEAFASQSGQRVAKMPVNRSKGSETGNVKAQAVG